MYAKEFRRPTPPRNYGGTAFREPARESVRDTGRETAPETSPATRRDAPYAAPYPASPYLAAPSTPSNTSSPPLPRDLLPESCPERESATGDAPMAGGCPSEPSAAQNEVESTHDNDHHDGSKADGASVTASAPGTAPSSGTSYSAAFVETSARAHRPPSPAHGLLGALIPPGLDSAHGNGLGFEELLLTGLILLLSQSQRDSDIILMLALLLFYQ